MALDIAVGPITSVGDLLVDGFGLLSPISPVSIGCRSSLKALVSPVGSESSGVSSLDLEDIKKQIPSSPTLSEENEEGATDSASGGGSSSESSSAASTISTTSTRTTSSSSSLDDDVSHSAVDNSDKQQVSRDSALPSSASSSPTAIVNELERARSPSATGPSNLCTKTAKEATPAAKEPIFSLPRHTIYYANRDILDLATNLRSTTSRSGFMLQYADLPQSNNLQFFLENRSQYNRLAPTSYIAEYRMDNCECCTFKFPINADTDLPKSSSSAAPVAPVGTNLMAKLGSGNQLFGPQQQRLKAHQQLQPQAPPAFHANNRFTNNTGMGRDRGTEYNMYQPTMAAHGNNGNSAGLSSRFNSGGYGAAASGSSLSGYYGNGNNGQQNSGNVGGGGNLMNGGPMGMQQQHYGSGSGVGNLKGISSSSNSSLRQQYDLLQQQKQYGNNYSMVGNNSANNNPAVVAAAARLQQHQQQQQSYYKKNQSMRFGNVGSSSTLASNSGAASNWKNAMSNSGPVPDASSMASKLFMELNNIQQQQYYANFL
ncbi:serine-rich adhesin for platelets-like [Anopheles bellator]|uniref:serine-rich adhesin for platelets-like n=1 Tax=Anopheles bellator TaxID=139047 RepID=UPI00264A0F4B|nr:serine-rich adhesin for platelets-like [Anopheles bellator]